MTDHVYSVSEIVGSAPGTIDDAIRSLQIIEAAHEAARTGRTVALAV